MAKLATYTSKVPVLDKPIRGSVIITKCTNNQALPGVAAVLAEFTTANTALEAANAALAALRDSLRQQTTVRDALEAAWTAKINALAAFVQSVTGGDAAAIESAGFYVVPAPQPPQPLPAPQNVKVATNGSPGVSKITWKPLHEAHSYVIQCSPDPITPTSWGESVTSTKASKEIAGATPGEVCWFRVAGVNPEGQGAWSEPARRPVM